MKAKAAEILSGVVTLILIFTAQASAEGSFKQQSKQLLSNEQSLSNQEWLVNQIYSAAFNDISPRYDDLYVIKTQDKGREIIIYCNTTYCYKNRNSVMTS